MYCSCLSCISFDSYIKPQPNTHLASEGICCISFDSYIKPQRRDDCSLAVGGCISFDSYIKPQLNNVPRGGGDRCISFDSYIKPQQNMLQLPFPVVVYLLTPTSNHNQHSLYFFREQLYIF